MAKNNGAESRMSDARVRQHIARLAAQMMYERIETEYFTAKRKAARQLGINSKYHPKDLPSNREIRDYIQLFACMHEGETRTQNLLDMRLIGLCLMRKLKRFRPALIGSTWTGHIRKGSDIDIHVFSDQIVAITMILDELGLEYEIENKRIIKHNEERIFTHIHIPGEFEAELTVYSEDKATYCFKSSITGKAIERATLPELEQFMAKEYPDVDLEEQEDDLNEQVDCFEIFKLLLNQLESVKQNPEYHPEGDALFHSLQVFELARFHRPYDEEFVLAALLHDIGKGIDASDHVEAALEALEGAITERTEFLIKHHMDAHLYKEGKLGHRAKIRLEEDENFDDLMLLQECDDKGRVPGAPVCSVDEALAFIKSINEES